MTLRLDETEDARPAKGPGRSERTGLTLAELFDMFPDDAAAEAWFRELRWPDGVRCPFCESDNIADQTRPTPFRCRDCRKHFSTKTNTLMHASKLGFRVWALAIYLMNVGIKGTSSLRLHRDLGVAQSTAWHLAHRIRESWADENPGPFGGPVAVDETYVGGKERNKRKAKRTYPKGGPVGKAPVVGMYDMATGKVIAKAIPRVHKRAIWDFVESNTERRALVISDEAGVYKTVLRPQVKVHHSRGEYVHDGYSTNAIESFWALFKRSYVGTYHWMSVKHLDRYVTEFAGRWNSRPLDTVQQMEHTARGLAGKRLPYAVLTAGPPARMIAGGESF